MKFRTNFLPGGFIVGNLYGIPHAKIIVKLTSRYKPSEFSGINIMSEVIKSTNGRYRVGSLQECWSGYLNPIKENEIS